MTPLIAGIDLSTRALHACLIPLDPDVQLDPILRVAKIEQADGKAERLRNVSKAMHDLLRDPLRPLIGNIGVADNEVVSVWIEKPPIFGRQKGRDELLQVYGAACASVPWRVTAVAGIDPQEWRRTIALEKVKDSWKLGAIDYAQPLFRHGLSEHEADAACIALAGRHITWSHDRSVNT